MTNNPAGNLDEHRDTPEQLVARIDPEDRNRRDQTLGEDTSNRPNEDSPTAAEDQKDIELRDDEDHIGVDDDDDENSDGGELEDLDETTDPSAEPGKPV